MTPERHPSAHKLPTVGANLKWDGREIPMLQHRDGWRLRSRSKSFPVDFFFATSSLVEAKKLARAKLAEMPEPQKRAKGTLEDAVQLYLGAPKRCSRDSAEGNVSRLRSVVRKAFNDETKTLSEVPVEYLSTLWPAYVAARQGKSRPDYSTRRAENYGINSAMKQAASIFIPSLRPYYRRHGLEIPQDATTIIWMALGQRVQHEAKDAELIEAWRKLREPDVDMWVTVGLARFAGLRQSEILACCGKWIVKKGAASYVEMRDREEDGYFTKTGRSYRALILDQQLAEYLHAKEPESPVITTPTRDRWIQKKPQLWLKPYVGSSKAPLHRLRGLYADHIKRETEDAILAHQAAIKAASENLGHTSTKTTTEHYTTND